MLAAYSGDLIGVQNALQSGANVNTPYYNNQSNTEQSVLILCNKNFYWLKKLSDQII